ncbi:MAG: hypothetical protein PHX18_07455 [Candidatus Gastranaerophilales bacterium]|nr:hypothetical protein [Candidatus Gastranaerophilales bacterium]
MLKKLLYVGVFMFLINTTAHAAITIDYDLYTIKNTEKNKIETAMMTEIAKNNAGTVFRDKANNIYYYKRTGKNGDFSYFVRFYQDFNDTNIFLVSSPKRPFKSNDIEQTLKNHNIPFLQSKDKQIIQEYKFDFVKYARENKPLDFVVIQKRTEWFENLVNKIDSTIIKDNKKVPQLPYKEDASYIKLRKLSSETYTGTGFKVIKNKYKLKQKTYKMAHAYEYLIENNSDSTLLIEKIDSDNIINIKDITKSTYIDLDRVDAAAYAGSFLAPFTLGVSLLACIPDWIRTVNIQTESIRYTYKFPEDYTVAPHGTARILVLRDRDNPKPLEFYLKINGCEEKFDF